MWRKQSAMRCACIRDADDAGFLTMRCVHSSGTTRVHLASPQENGSTLIPENPTQSEHFVTMWAVSSDI